MQKMEAGSHAREATIRSTAGTNIPGRHKIPGDISCGNQRSEDLKSSASVLVGTSWEWREVGGLGNGDGYPAKIETSGGAASAAPWDHLDFGCGDGTYWRAEEENERVGGVARKEGDAVGADNANQEDGRREKSDSRGDGRAESVVAVAVGGRTLEAGPSEAERPAEGVARADKESGPYRRQLTREMKGEEEGSSR
ncbi:hypothetical protein DFH07DRAFT_1005956 [Mycena maculata]|uniref:Uncharacterized protein n=1 Tax=Mycena maculata TaxID=230809 RepID=A0AAD7MLL2_9AGAR|nr:hypothetical protein DFH07DRAFT_1005956 [Mycena maculata]